MAHLVPLNWPLIFLLTSIQLLLTYTILWWTLCPSYKTFIKASILSSYFILSKLFFLLWMCWS